METTALEGGFSDAPVAAARAFRAALDAMARPGTITVLEGALPPPPVSVAAGTLLLTLCDPETPVALCGAADTSEMRDWLTFHTGAPFVPVERAMFALGAWEDLIPITRFQIGTPEYPDRSATLIVECAGLEASGTRLTGPGIEAEASLALPELEAFRRNRALFPLGLDFFFTAGDRVAALPRTTIVEAG
ncbi:MAG: phosphonate C-P lyase system protein PhnH [Pseudomonadota bacterium]